MQNKKDNMAKTKILQNIGIFLAFLLFLSIAYWPTISSYYVFHDDVVFFLRSPQHFEPPGTLFALAMGRFIGIFLTIGISLLVDSISDLNVVRLLTVFQLSLCGFFLSIWIRKRTASSTISFLLSFVIFTLPVFQVMVSRAGMAYHPVSILFAIWAAMVADRISLDGCLRKRFLSLPFFGSILLFIGALSVFQPGAMFYWALAGFVLLFSSSEPFEVTRRKVVNLFLPAFLGLLFYRGILQFIKESFTQYNLYDYNPCAITADYIGKIGWFFKEPVFNILNFWNIFPNVLYPAIAGLFVLGAVVLVLIKFFKQKEKQCWAGVALKISVIFSLVFLSALPNLVIPQNIPFYRCYMGLAALVVFILAWAINQYVQLFYSLKRRTIFIAILLGFNLLGIAQANQTVLKYRVTPSSKELRFVMNAFDPLKMNKYKRIYIIQPDQEDGDQRGDEYGGLTTFYGHSIFGLVSCVVREAVSEKLNLYHIDIDHKTGKISYVFTLKEDKNKKLVYQIIVDFGQEEKTSADFKEPTLIIDMRKF